jgi:hypothetical protein
MAIRAKYFYEGAALHRLIRNGAVERIRWEDPFFEADGRLLIYLKYTKGRKSPWSFTLTPDEQKVLETGARRKSLVVGLICGGDGIAVVAMADLQEVAFQTNASSHIACYRRHSEFYEIAGPNGALARKVAPSDWDRLLEKFK